MRVTLFVPCFVDAVFPRAGMAITEILERLGHEVVFAESLVCCGQPAFNSGYWDEARPFAEKAIAALRGAETVVIGSGSCGAMLKVFYPQLMAGTAFEDDAQSLSARVFEFSDFLVSRLGVTDLGARFDGVATFHDGCHGLRELGIKSQPRKLLERVAGLSLIEMDGAESCCGFGGTFSAKFPAISSAMGEVKCESAIRTGAEFIISNDASCLMQIRGILDRQNRNGVRTLHLAEVLNSR